MDKIYLYKTAVKSVSYDETHWYINDEPQPQNDGDGIAEFKSNARAESFRIIANVSFVTQVILKMSPF